MLSIYTHAQRPFPIECAHCVDDLLPHAPLLPWGYGIIIVFHYLSMQVLNDLKKKKAGDFILWVCCLILLIISRSPINFSYKIKFNDVHNYNYYNTKVITRHPDNLIFRSSFEIFQKVSVLNKLLNSFLHPGPILKCVCALCS